MIKYRSIIVLLCCLMLSANWQMQAQTHNTDCYTVIGDSALLFNRANWDLDEDANNMTLTGGIWQLQVRNKYLKKTGTACQAVYHFGVVWRHSMKWIYPCWLISDECYVPEGYTEKQLRALLSPTNGKQLQITTSGIYDLVFSYIEGNDKPTVELTLIKAVDNDKFTLTVESANESQGTVSGGGEYECSKSVTVKATPEPGYKFVRWSDGQTTASRTVKVTKDMTLTAEFAPCTYTLVGDADLTNNEADWDPTSAANAMTLQGELWTLEVKNKLLTKTGTACHATYRYAVAQDGGYAVTYPENVFNGTKHREGRGNSRTVKQTGRYNLKYTYNQRTNTLKCDTTLVEVLPNPTYTIKVTSSDESKGTVTGGGTYECGENVTITVTPIAGNTFVKWNDGNTSKTRTITVSEDAWYEALFEGVDYTLIGDGDLTNENKEWDPTALVNRMTPDGDAWTITVQNVTLYKTGTGCRGSYYYGVAKNMEYSDTYPANIFTETTPKRTQGQAMAVSKSGVYNLTFTYAPTSKSLTCTKTLITEISEQTYHVDILANDPAGGTTTGSGDYECGTKIKYQATALPGYRFVRFSIDKSEQPLTTNSSTTRSLTVSKDTTITAIFEKVICTLIGDAAITKNHADWDNYSVDNEMTLNGEGIFTVTVENAILEKTTQSSGAISQGCRDHYRFAFALNNTPTYPLNTSKSLQPIEIAVNQAGIYNITYQYKIGSSLNAYELTLVEALPNKQFVFDIKSNNEEYGTVTGGGTYDCGTNVTLKATPTTGSHFTGWSDGVTTVSRTLYATKDTTIVANFERAQYTLIGDPDLVRDNANWDVSSTANDIQLIDGVWTLTLHDVVLESTSESCHGTYRYAVTYNHDFNTTFPKNIFKTDGTRRSTTNGNSFPTGLHAGKYDLTFTYKEGATKPSCTYKLIEELPNAIYTIGVQADNDDYGIVSGGGEIECGKTTTIDATPKRGYRFVKWSDGYSTKKRTVTATKDYTYVATFEDDSYTIVGPTSIVNGTTDWNLNEPQNVMDGGYWIVDNYWETYWGHHFYLFVESKQLNTCNSPYYFRIVNKHSYERAYPKDNNASFTVKQNGLYDIYYTWEQDNDGIQVYLYLIEAYGTKFNVTAVPDNSLRGSVSGNKTDVECGASVTLNATPNSGYQFVGWSDGATDNPYTLTVQGDVNLTAHFKCSGTCDEPTTMFLDYDVTTLPTEYVGTHPTIRAYPPTMARKVPKMACLGDDEQTDDGGALSGQFSVSATKKVQFSKGNLQYQASTDTWRFAEKQTTYIGEDNIKASATYDGWIDLFNFGTSGWSGGVKNYQPWASFSYSDYQFDNCNGKTINLTGDLAKADWGVYNKISNGGNEAGIWRTLTDTEWKYLLQKRTNASKLYYRIVVDGVYGLMLLPDDWVEIPEIPITNKTKFVSKSQMKRLEENGAVFLCKAGYVGCDGKIYYYNYGVYATATYYECMPMVFMFDDYYTPKVDWLDGTNKSAVRLVRDVE